LEARLAVRIISGARAEGMPVNTSSTGRQTSQTHAEVHISPGIDDAIPISTARRTGKTGHLTGVKGVKPLTTGI
jgi:hypothetical protein